MADVEETIKKIRETYLKFGSPFVIGYSGGKDSTTVLELVWRALENVELRSPVYVVFADTKMEIPSVVEFVDSLFEKINKKALQAGKPFYAVKVEPSLEKRFWVNVLGKGYPAPSRTFRWCTSKLKVEPTNKFVKELIKSYGKVVIALGVRLLESQNRRRTIQKYHLEGDFIKHNDIKSALIYAPIKDWSAEDVWEFLLSSQSSFGIDHYELYTLYRQSEGECPVVAEFSNQTSVSCGNSRFGCWICTVVKKEKSLTNLAKTNQEYLRLLDFRQELLEVSREPQSRSIKRRDGRIWRKNGVIQRGPLLLDVRRKLLKKLLLIQKQTSLSLIDEQELLKIREIWLNEDDWEDSVNKIYEEVYGKRLTTDVQHFVFSEQDKLALHPLIIRLITAYQRGLSLKKVLAEDWDIPFEKKPINLTDTQKDFLKKLMQELLKLNPETKNLSFALELLSELTS